MHIEINELEKRTDKQKNQDFFFFFEKNNKVDNFWQD